ncbi:unnamed protein product, partial [Ranitomeya imitator]
MPLCDGTLRVRRIVSCETHIDKRFDEMCKKFLCRGYHRVELDKFRERALSKNRDELLIPKMTMQSQRRIPFVTTYDGMSKQVANIIRRHWPLLGKGHTNIVELQLPPLFSYRRNRNLKDQLVISDIGSTKRDLQTTFNRPSLGNLPCLGCACCNNMIKGSSFCHPRTGKKYEIHRRFTCTSSFVVYVLSCHCGLFYVEETTMEIKARISKHKSTIRTGLIELPKKELRWIFELDTLYPKGMNIEYQQNCMSSRKWRRKAGTAQAPIPAAGIGACAVRAFRRHFLEDTPAVEPECVFKKMAPESADCAGADSGSRNRRLRSPRPPEPGAEEPGDGAASSAGTGKGWVSPWPNFSELEGIALMIRIFKLKQGSSLIDSRIGIIPTEVFPGPISGPELRRRTLCWSQGPRFIHLDAAFCLALESYIYIISRLFAPRL